MATAKKKTTAKAAPKKAAPAKKPAAKTKAAPTKTTTTKVSPKKVETKAKRSVSEEERMHMIATAAYFKAEQRGFVGGNPDQDWAEAEREVSELLSK